MGHGVRRGRPRRAQLRASPPVRRRLARAGFEILNKVVLNQVLVSFGDTERTKRLIEAIQHEGTGWAGVTFWQGRTAMRISVSNWSTPDTDVERSADAIICVADALK
jgi:hypothetical protein